MEWVKIGTRYSAPINHKALKKVGIDVYVEDEADNHSKEKKFVARFYDNDIVKVQQHANLKAAHKFLEKHMTDSLKRTNKRLKEICLALEVSE